MLDWIFGNQNNSFNISTLFILEIYIKYLSLAPIPSKLSHMPFVALYQIYGLFFN